MTLNNARTGLFALLGFAAAFVAANVAASLLLPPQPGVLPPQQDGQPTQLRAQLAAQDPQVLLLGPSRLTQQIDPQMLAGAMGLRVARLTARRAGSAWLYLAIKNVVPAQRAVVIFFADWQLTFPEYYADSGRDDLAYLLSPSEPEVERLAYCGRMPETEFRLRRAWPLYACRESASKALDDVFNPAAAAGLFGRERQNPTWREAHERSAERARTAYDGRMWNFAQEVKESFLPLIINECDNKRLRAVFVELPGQAADDTSAAQEYRMQLQRYLAGRGARYIAAYQIPAPKLVSELAGLIAADKP